MEPVSKNKAKMSSREYKTQDSKRIKTKHENAKFWKRAKKIAMHVQSRRENKFGDSLLPDRHLTRRNQRYANYLFELTHSPLLQKCPLGPGWS